jgi:hypothetical protein
VSLACLALVLPPPTQASRDEQDRASLETF